MRNVLDQWKNSLFRPVDCSSLGLFRFIFGLLLIYQAFFIFDSQFIQLNFVEAVYHFPHPLFEWLNLRRYSPGIVQAIFLVMGLGAVGICAGIFLRLSCVLFFCTFGYVFLFEKAIYNAHYYLILLIVAILFFSGAHQWPSLPTFRKSKSVRAVVPYWQIWLIQFQFVIVYFYGGLSKFNADWIIFAEPLRSVLVDRSLFGISMGQLWIAYVVSVMGIVIDIGLAWSLLFKRFLKLAFLTIVAFNLSNVWIFEGDIGIFPFLMISAIALFLPFDGPRRIAATFFKEPDKVDQSSSNAFVYSRITFGLIVLYCIIQMVVPLRHWLYPGDVRWTYEGGRYSWFLKVNAKKTDLQVLVTDPKTGKTLPINHMTHLTPNQLWMDNIPDMFVQYTQYLIPELAAIGIDNPRIHVKSMASLNNRRFQPYYRSDVDFSQIQYSPFSHAQWIVPLESDSPREYGKFRD